MVDYKVLFTLHCRHMEIERPNWWYEPDSEELDEYTFEEYQRLLEEQDSLEEQEALCATYL